MKRNLFGSIKAQPYTSGTAVDREGFLSAVVAAKVTAAGTISVAVTDSDTEDGTFAAVADPRLSMGKEITGVAVAKDTLVPINLDLVGCKRFVKVTITTANSAAATYALVLGDPAKAPVED